MSRYEDSVTRTIYLDDYSRGGAIDIWSSIYDNLGDDYHMGHSHDTITLDKFKHFDLDLAADDYDFNLDDYIKVNTQSIQDDTEISREINIKISAERRAYEDTYGETPSYVRVPQWVWNWLNGEAQNMGAYIENPADPYSIIEYMGLKVLRDDTIQEIEDIKVF